MYFKRAAFCTVNTTQLPFLKGKVYSKVINFFKIQKLCHDTEWRELFVALRPSTSPNFKGSPYLVGWFFGVLDFSNFEKKRKTFQRETAEKMCLFWMMRSGNHALFILDEINPYWYSSFTVHIS